MKIEKKGSPWQTLTGLSRDFETIGYVQLHVVWVWLQVLRKKRQFFITQFTLQTLFSKTDLNWLSRTMSKTITILRVFQSSHHHKFWPVAVSLLVAVSLNKGYLLPTSAWKITLTIFHSSRHQAGPDDDWSIQLKRWWVIFRLVTDNLLFTYAAANWEATEMQSHSFTYLASRGVLYTS